MPHHLTSPRSPSIEPLEARAMLSAAVAKFRDYYATNTYGPKQINLAYYASDPSVEKTVVDMKYDVGTVRVALLDKTSPLTTANFLKYVDANRWDNSFIHRSVKDFIVQGGGFKYDGKSTTTVESFGNVQNEYKLSNTRGTMAMAKLGGDPNSATNQWFYNLGDNSANLDNQNGGFTVFARVVGDGMKVVDKIAALPTQNFDGNTFSDVPTRDYDGKSTLKTSNLVNLTDVSRVPLVTGTTVAKVAASSNKTSLVTTQIKSGKLILTYSKTKTGTAFVTVNVTAVDGTMAKTMFRVRVAAPSKTVQALPQVALAAMPTKTVEKKPGVAADVLAM